MASVGPCSAANRPWISGQSCCPVVLSSSFSAQEYGTSAKWNALSRMLFDGKLRIAWGLLISYIICVMEQQMTVEEMRRQFDAEWILVGDPQTDEGLQVLAGKVLHHGKDRDEVYRQAVARRPG